MSCCDTRWRRERAGRSWGSSGHRHARRPRSASALAARRRSRARRECASCRPERRLRPGRPASRRRRKQEERDGHQRCGAGARSETTASAARAHRSAPRRRRAQWRSRTRPAGNPAPRPAARAPPPGPLRPPGGRPHRAPRSRARPATRPPRSTSRRDEDQGQREGDDDSAARPMCGEELGMGPEEIEELLCDRERPERPEMRTPLENLPSPRRRSRSQVDTPPRLPTTAGHRGDASETNPIPRMTPTHCRIRPSDPNRGVSFLRSGRAARRGL